MFSDRLLGERCCSLLIQLFRTTTRNYSIFQFRRCLLYTLACGDRGYAREVRMGLSLLRSLAINEMKKAITLFPKSCGSC